MRQSSCWAVLLLLTLGSAGTDAAPSPLEHLETLIADGQYAEAENAARGLLAKVEVDAGSDSGETADVLHWLVKALRGGGKGTEAEALELADRSLRIREKNLGSDHLLVADSLSEKSNVLYDRGEYESCEPLLMRALGIYERSQGPEDATVADVHNNLGNLFRATARFERARDELARAVEIYEIASGPESIDVADALSNLAGVVGDLGDLAGSEPLIRRALEIREARLGPEHPQVGLSVSNLGYLKWRLGEYEAAKPLMERAIAIREKALGPDHPSLGDSLHNYYLLLGFMNEPGQDEVIARAFSIYERASHWHLGGSLAMHATTLNGRGEFIAARQHNERALEILEQHDGPEHPRIGWTLNNLAEVHMNLGDYDRARECLERARAILEKSFGAEHHGVTTTLASMAKLEGRIGNLDEAERISGRAVAIAEKSLGEDHPDVASLLETVGEVFRRSGDYRRAKHAYERALAIRERAFGSDHPWYSHILVLLADVSFEADECAEALPVYNEVLTGARSPYWPGHPNNIVLRGRTAECLARTGARADAFDHVIVAENLSREHLRLTLTGLAERAGLQFAATRESGLDLALSLLVDDPDVGSAERGVDAVIRSRGLVLDEMAERRRWSDGAIDPGLARLWTEFSERSYRLAKLMVKGPSDTSMDEVLEKARADRDRAERELAEASRAFRLKREREEIGLVEVAAALPAGSGLVGFYRFQHSRFERGDPGRTAEVTRTPSYLAFILTGQSERPRIVSLGAADKIDRLIEHFRSNIAAEANRPAWGAAQAESTYRRDAEALRRLIWDPIAPWLPGVTRLFVVPDGALHLINLAALPIGDGEYLIERGPTIHHLSAERDLVADAGDVSGVGLLAVGNPAFDEPNLFAALAPNEQVSVVARGDVDARRFRGQRSACGSFQTHEFERLPATEAETNDVGELWRSGLEGYGQSTPPAFERLIGVRANESAFKRMAPGRRVLHLATHAFFLGDSCSDDTLESPLLLSGLAFAGANHRQAAGPDEDDGILTSEEITTLDLDGVDWAVLSACETGLGEMRTGEGVLGLRRAFRVAGAKTLIMTLWLVEDEPTRAWMALLYERRFVDRLATADAVNRATLESLQHRRREGVSTHPFYWAGFVAAGDWR
jgi:CHAT domain-containing protein/tetratricopeptide (TPR) repeat protein